MKHALFRIAAVSGALLAGACATPHRDVLTHFDFSRIRRISVVPFEGPGGATATNEFIRALVSTGIEVADAQHAGDAVLKGTVTDYKPNNPLMVFLGNTPLTMPAGQTVVVDNALVSPGGAQVMPEGASLGNRSAQVVSIISTVGINVNLIDPSTKSSVWAGAASYEALDTPGALQAVVNSLTKSLGQVVPQMNPHHS